MTDAHEAIGQHVEQEAADVSKMKEPLRNVFRTASDDEKKKFDAAAQAVQFKDFNAVLTNNPREPTAAEINTIRQSLEKQGFKF